MDDGETLHSESGVSVFDGSPFVQLRWGTQSGQLDPDEARQLALAILETAEAADSDAAVYAELTQTMELDQAVAVQFLAALRARRSEG